MQYTLVGPELSEELLGTLTANGFVVTLATPNTVHGNLPYAVLPINVSRNNGKLGGMQLLERLQEYDFVVVATQSDPHQELAIRVVDRESVGVVHLVFDNCGQFTYTAISTRDFLSKFSESRGTTALAKARSLFSRIERKTVACNEYIPSEQGWNYLQMRQKLGWNWRPY